MPLSIQNPFSFFLYIIIFHIDWPWKSHKKKSHKTLLDSEKRWVMPELGEKAHKEEKLKSSQNHKYDKI